MQLWPWSELVARFEVSESWRRASFRFVLLLSDLFMLALAFRLAYWVRFDLKLTVAPEIVPSAAFYADVVSIVIPVWLCLFALHGVYGWDILLGGTSEYSRVFSATTVGAMLVVLATFLVPSFVVSRSWVFSAWLLSSTLACGVRFGLRRVVYAMREKGRWLTPAIVVGTNGEALSLAQQLLNQQVAGYDILGVVETSRKATPSFLAVGETDLLLLGSIDEIEAIITRHHVKEVIVAASCLERGQLLDLFELIQPLSGVTMRLSTGLYEVLTTGVEVRTCASVPLIKLNTLRLGRLQSALKTAMEYLFTVAALIIVAPLMVIIAVLVKLDSPGPVIYRHRVLGVGGRGFDALKFRTMYVKGDEILQRNPHLMRELRAHGKLKEDPRVTRLGKTLRRYSLDELPQFFNVLRGEMSLVGPRFITLQEAGRYGRCKTNLMTVKPGITGLWQVSGRSELSYEDRVRLDMNYIRNYSIWTDLQILLIQTPSAVIRARGAY